MNKNSIINFLENTTNLKQDFVIEVGHMSVGLNNKMEFLYGQLLKGNRIIPEGLIESIIEGFELVEFLEENKKKVNVTLSLSDIYGLSSIERGIIKSILDLENGLSFVFKSLGFDKDFLLKNKRYLDNGEIILQSNSTSSIRNKISQIKDRYKDPEKIYEDKGYLLFDVMIGEFSGIILFSKGCFEEHFNILDSGIPLILGEKGGILATQCGPTVTGIQKQTIGKRKNVNLVTIDNKDDLTIKTKSIRGQELLKVLYGINSSFFTPINHGELSFIHNYNKEEKEYDYKVFLEICIEKLVRSGYDSCKIYGKNEYLFFQNLNNDLDCDLGFCNLNKND